MLASLCGAEPGQLGDMEPIPETVVAPDGKSPLTVEEHLGTARFSQVFSVRIDDNLVAIKRPRHSDSNKRARLAMETSILRRLSVAAGDGVPSLLPRYANVVEPRSIALASVGIPAMAWLDTAIAPSADDVDSTLIRVAFARKVTTSLLNTLHVAHRLRISHNDIRPPNVIINPRSDPPDAVVLIDWGISTDLTAPRPPNTARLTPEQFFCLCATDLIRACLVGMFFSGSRLADVALSWDQLVKSEQCNNCIAYEASFETWRTGLRAMMKAQTHDPAALEPFYKPWWENGAAAACAPAHPDTAGHVGLVAAVQVMQEANLPTQLRPRRQSRR